MLRTLIFGAILGYAGKKLYESGALKEFSDDLKTRISDTHIANSPAPAPVPARAPATAPQV